MKQIIAFFEDGNEIATSINGTDKEIKEYYVGNTFNLGVEKDDMQKCISVVIFPEDIPSRVALSSLNISRREVKEKGRYKMHHGAIETAKKINDTFPTKVMPVNDHLLKQVEDIEVNGYKIHFNDFNNLFSVDNGEVGPQYYDTQEEAIETAERG